MEQADARCRRWCAAVLGQALISCGASQGGAAAAALGLHKTTPPPRVQPLAEPLTGPCLVLSLTLRRCHTSTTFLRRRIPRSHLPDLTSLTTGTFQLGQVSVLHHRAQDALSGTHMSSVRRRHWRSPAKHTTPLVSSKVLPACSAKTEEPERQRWRGHPSF